MWEEQIADTCVYYISLYSSYRLDLDCKVSKPYTIDYITSVNVTILSIELTSK